MEHHELNQNRLRALKWTKSQDSAGNGACVEAAILHDGNVGVGDSKRRQAIGDEAPIMTFTRGEWNSLTAQIKRDVGIAAELAVRETVVYALDGVKTLALVPNEAGGVYWTKSDQPDVVHTFSAGTFTPDNFSELGAAVLGFVKGEFDYQTLIDNQQQSMVS